MWAVFFRSVCDEEAFSSFICSTRMLWCCFVQQSVCVYVCVSQSGLLSFHFRRGCWAAALCRIILLFLQVCVCVCCIGLRLRTVSLRLRVFLGLSLSHVPTEICVPNGLDAWMVGDQFYPQLCWQQSMQWRNDFPDFGKVHYGRGSTMWAVFFSSACDDEIRSVKCLSFIWSLCLFIQSFLIPACVCVCVCLFVWLCVSQWGLFIFCCAAALCKSVCVCVCACMYSFLQLTLSM